MPSPQTKKTGAKEELFHLNSAKIQWLYEFIHIWLCFVNISQESQKHEIGAMRPQDLFTFLLITWFAGGLGASVFAQSAPPYQCGFVLESQAAIREVYGPELKVLDLHPGDVIADVGGSNGYRMGMFAAITDSLEIFVEDIDSLCLNATEVAAVQQYYSQVRGEPLHSTFHWVLGDASSTHLPRRAIDKVLVTVAYHHFADPQAMLADIAGALKPTGKIYLIENVVRRDGQRRRRLCNDPLLSEASLRRTLEVQGLHVSEVYALGRWWTKMFVLEVATSP